MHIDLEDLRFEHGGALLVKRALRLAAVGETVTVAGRHPDLTVYLRAWCRTEGTSSGRWTTLEPATPESSEVLLRTNGGVLRSGQAGPILE